MQKLAITALAIGALAFTLDSAHSFIAARIELTNGALHGARLVGTGCEGHSGKVYGIEESDFPQCEKIELINKESE